MDEFRMAPIFLRFITSKIMHGKIYIKVYDKILINNAASMENRNLKNDVKTLL